MRVAPLRPRGPLTSGVVSRSLLSLLVAAAIATAAAFGTSGLEEVAASADDGTRAAPVDAPTPASLEPGPVTTGLSPRVVVPERDTDVAAAPASELDTRRLPGTGELLAATGTSRDPVHRGGRTVWFSVEVESVTGLDPDAVAAVVEEALYDERSWARDHDLRRVAPEDAWIHVVVASPDSVDTLCQRVGLETAGWLSCWTGTTAALNVERWTQGVAHHDDLAEYRRYLVNHEVGHGLGHGHVDCPGSGRLAPLMQQQSISLQGCIANAWQYPEG